MTKRFLKLHCHCGEVIQIPILKYFIIDKTYICPRCRCKEHIEARYVKVLDKKSYR